MDDKKRREPPLSFRLPQAALDALEAYRARRSAQLGRPISRNAAAVELIKAATTSPQERQRTT